ncbi:MAG: hypothetical protein ABEJ35_02545 [Halobacteriaceae archaeon]
MSETDARSREEPPSMESEAVRAALGKYARRVREEQVQLALRRLQGEGGLTEGQRRQVQQLGRRLTGEVLAGPMSTLAEESASDQKSRTAARVAVLFGLADAGNAEVR